MTEALSAYSKDINETVPAQLRCRAVLFDMADEHILLIARTKPGRDPYIVFPGGGLEESDATAQDGIMRELAEELSLSSEEVVLSDKVMIYSGEYFFIGNVTSDRTDFTVGGPESERPASESGTYEPAWFSLASLEGQPVQPGLVAGKIIAAYKAINAIAENEN